MTKDAFSSGLPAGEALGIIGRFENLILKLISFLDNEMNFPDDLIMAIHRNGIKRTYNLDKNSIKFVEFRLTEL